MDERGNILLSTFLRADAEFLREVRLLHPLKRDVDWRGEWKSCVTQSRRRACIVQQAGEMAPKGGECRSCGNGRGAFTSCCVLTYGDQILFGGACGNCGFNQGGNKCSLREPGKELAGWARDYLAKSNPGHELVRGKVAVRSLSLPNEISVDPYFQEPRGAATPVAKRTRASQEKGKSSSDAGPSGTRETQAEKDQAAKNKAEWERAAKEKAERERAAKEKAEKERAAKEKAEKEKADRERAKGKGRKKRYFENDWLSSPLNDPTVTNREDFTRAAEAYDAIPEMIEALQEAREALKAWLIDNKQLSEDEEEGEEEEEDDDPFAAYTKKRKRTE